MYCQTYYDYRKTPGTSSLPLTLNITSSDSPLLLEYLMVPLNIIFVTVAVLLWLRKELGVTII